MYMAPEQAKGETLDHRADLFSLGSVLYQMASGRPPFRANGTLAVLKRVAEDTPRPIREIIPETPQWLCDIIAKLHAKDPDDRFQSAREVADLLGRCLAEIQRPAGRASRSCGRPSRRRRSRRPRPRGRSADDPTPRVPARRLGGRRRRAPGAPGRPWLHGSDRRHRRAAARSSACSPRRARWSSRSTTPGSVVQIDGSDLVITGAGVQEIRLKPGAHTVQARKDGKPFPVSSALVTVARNGRQIVRVSRDAQSGEPRAVDAAQVASKATDAAAWERSVSALPAVERAKAVAVRLEELNPGFDGAIFPTIVDGVVTGLELNIDRVTDISPIRAFTGLTSFTCHGSDAFKGQFVDGVRSTGYEQGRIHIKSVGKSRFVDLCAAPGPAPDEPELCQLQRVRPHAPEGNEPEVAPRRQHPGLRPLAAQGDAAGRPRLLVHEGHRPQAARRDETDQGGFRADRRR